MRRSLVSTLKLKLLFDWNRCRRSRTTGLTSNCFRTRVPAQTISPPSSPSSLHPRGCRFSIIFCSLPFHILSVSSCCLSSSCLSTLQSLESCGTIAKNNTKRFQLSIIISCAFYYFDGYLLLTNNGCHTLGVRVQNKHFPRKNKHLTLMIVCVFQRIDVG